MIASKLGSESYFAPSAWPSAAYCAATAGRYRAAVYAPTLVPGGGPHHPKLPLSGRGPYALSLVMYFGMRELSLEPRAPPVKLSATIAITSCLGLLLWVFKR